MTWAVPDSKVLFVTGKGGVGKTAVSRAIAASSSSRTLWVEFENPLREPGEIRRDSLGFDSLNCEASTAFEEYMGIKIRVQALARLFVRNRLIKYMAKASPGIHELVLLGKVWYEIPKRERIIVDAPSTGYLLALFHAARNFARLFGGGPIHDDAARMLATFDNPRESRCLIVATPEEMPLIEGLELRDKLRAILPGNPPAFLANRLFPSWEGRVIPGQGVIPSSGAEYLARRSVRERENLLRWSGVEHGCLDFVDPRGDVTRQLAERIAENRFARPERCERP